MRESEMDGSKGAPWAQRSVATAGSAPQPLALTATTAAAAAIQWWLPTVEPALVIRATAWGFHWQPATPRASTPSPPSTHKATAIARPAAVDSDLSLPAPHPLIELSLRVLAVHLALSLPGSPWWNRANGSPWWNGANGGGPSREGKRAHTIDPSRTFTSSSSGVEIGRGGLIFSSQRRREGPNGDRGGRG